MGSDTVRRNLTIKLKQDKKLNTLNDDYSDLSKSLLNRRALAYYFAEGIERDSVVRELVGDEAHKDIVDKV